MKRIRNIRDLEYEKLKLRVKQLELEKQMQGSWMKLVSKLSWENVTKEKKPFQKNVHFNPGNPLLSGVLSYGTSFLSHKLGILAGKEVEGLAEDVLENLSVRINAAISKKENRNA